MGFPKIYRLNSGVQYPIPAVDFDTQALANYRIDELKDLLTNLKIYVTPSSYFTAKVEDVFSQWFQYYTRTQFEKFQKTSDMTFWQNQLNFAVWMATTGCGISQEQLLSDNTPSLVSSFFRFHVYYQIRKILKEIEAALPSDKDFKATNNTVNISKVVQITNEFRASKYMNPTYTKFSDNHKVFKYDPIQESVFEKRRIEFTEKYQKWEEHFKHHVDTSDYDKHSTDLALVKNIDWRAHAYGTTDGWIYYILKNSKGLTVPGITRINESIRTYVYCILGAQTTIKTPIVGASNSNEAQKQFVNLLNDSINKSTTLELKDSINRYQNSISLARMKLDYVLGENLYLIPSDMVLKIGSIDHYNNNIQLATPDMSFGKNSNINTLVKKQGILKNNTAAPKIQRHAISSGLHKFAEHPGWDLKEIERFAKKVKAGGHLTEQEKSYLVKKGWDLHEVPKPSRLPQTSQLPTPTEAVAASAAETTALAEDHEYNKTAIIIFGTLLLILGISYF